MLTPAQVRTFWLCHPEAKGDIKAIPPKKLKNALRLCEATIAHNRDRILDVLAERHED